MPFGLIYITCFGIDKYAHFSLLGVLIIWQYLVCVAVLSGS